MWHDKEDVFLRLSSGIATHFKHKSKGVLSLSQVRSVYILLNVLDITKRIHSYIWVVSLLDIMGGYAS